MTLNTVGVKACRAADEPVPFAGLMEPCPVGRRAGSMVRFVPDRSGPNGITFKVTGGRYAETVEHLREGPPAWYPLRDKLLRLLNADGRKVARRW